MMIKSACFSHFFVSFLYIFLLFRLRLTFSLMRTKYVKEHFFALFSRFYRFIEVIKSP